MVNGDDEALMRHKINQPVRYVSVVKSVVRTEAGLQLKNYPGVSFPVFGSHQLMPIALALTMAEFLGVEAGTGAKIVAEHYLPPVGRGGMLEGVQGTTILDDSYNSSPAALTAALRQGKEFAGARRFVAMVGRMNELGEHAEKYHREVASVAGESADLLVSVGQYGQLVADESGLPKERVLVFGSTEALMADSAAWLQPGDVVLVKGSQNAVRLERFVKTIMAHPEEAGENLCRQEAFWVGA